MSDRREAWAILAPWLFRIVLGIVCGFCFGWPGLICFVLGGIRVSVSR